MTTNDKKYKRMCDWPEYKVRAGMIQRCTNPKNSGWPRYGGRGITVCDRWLDDFLNFYADMGPRPSDAHTLERVDNDGNYEPGNCKWATWDEQANNRSDNWTEDQIATLKMMWLSFCTAEEIGEKLGKSADSIRQGAHRFDFRRDKGVMISLKRFPELAHLIQEKGVVAFKGAAKKKSREIQASNQEKRKKAEQDRIRRFFRNRDVLNVSSKNISSCGHFGSFGRA